MGIGREEAGRRGIEEGGRNRVSEGHGGGKSSHVDHWGLRVGMISQKMRFSDICDFVS